MAEEPRLKNRVRAYRKARGWSQDELAERSGISRTGISAIEMNRLVPSTAAALGLAAALECRVEDLFELGGEPVEPTLAWPARDSGSRFWRVEVQGITRLYPVETTLTGVLAHDGSDADAGKTLLIACCDPSVGLLAHALALSSGIRLIALPRSSRSALELLKVGLVHAAGVHLCRSSERGGNARVVREILGEGFALLHVTRWEEGVVTKPSLRFASARSLARTDLRWVGREPGSGARQCLDELLEGRRPPRRLASDHRGVVEAVRSGWADAGVCLRLPGEEAGLAFLSVRREDYDLCLPRSLLGDWRIKALIEAVRSIAFKRTLRELPGYETERTGEIEG